MVKPNRFNQILCFAMITCSLLLSSCISIDSTYSNQPELTAKPTLQFVPVTYFDAFGNQPEIITPQQLLKLSAQQESQFLSYFNQELSDGTAEHEIVAKFLSHFIADFDYHSETLTASEAMARKEGNCLSLAILTSALAQLANVEVKYQLMEMRPIFLKKGNTVFTAQHVRSILYDPKYIKEKSSILFMKPLIAIDYFPSRGTSLKRMVSDEEFYSMYYRNKAAEAISEENYQLAYWLSTLSFQYSANNSHAVNMLALVYDKMGFDENATEVYQFGIEQTDEKLELLSNYKNFLIKMRQPDKATIIKQQISLISQPNPFEWLRIAEQELAKGELDEALRYYDKVVDIAPYLDQGFSGRAKIEFLKGNTYRAKLAFEKAVELSVDKQSSDLYRAKMAALESYSESK